MTMTMAQEDAEEVEDIDDVDQGDGTGLMAVEEELSILSGVGKDQAGIKRYDSGDVEDEEKEDGGRGPTDEVDEIVDQNNNNNDDDDDDLDERAKGTTFLA